jgi:hypothetical protein
MYVVGAVVLALLSKGSIGRQWVFVDVGLCALFGEVIKFLMLSTTVLWRISDLIVLVSYGLCTYMTMLHRT